MKRKLKANNHESIKTQKKRLKTKYNETNANCGRYGAGIVIDADYLDFLIEDSPATLKHWLINSLKGN